jgi:hypothetical protein
MSWQRRLPVNHDHVGHMIWSDHSCACSECGQEWMLVREESVGRAVASKWVPVFDE